MSHPATTAAAAPPPPTALRERFGQILALGLPIIGGMASQNVLNLIDTAMVGHLGDSALAAVGTASFAVGTAVALFMGASGGVQALVARRVGEGRQREAAIPLNGALLLVTLTALPLSLALHAATPWLFPLLNDDPAVVRDAVPYMQARMLALFAAGVNFSFRGYWNGVRLPGLYMRTLIAMHCINIALNWVLIFGKLGMPELGAPGAGVASAIATYCGSLIYLYMGVRQARPEGFLRGLPDRRTLASLVKVGLPNGLHGMLLLLGFAMLFWILGQIGTATTAAGNVLFTLRLVAFLPAMGLGFAAATLVGQALGRGDAHDAKRWGVHTSMVAIGVVSVIGAAMVLFPEALLALFLHDDATRQLAILPLRITGLSLPLDAIGLVLTQALVGAGATRSALLISAGFQWLLLLPAAYLIGPQLGFGLLGVWLAEVAHRIAQAGVFAFVWMRGRWAELQLD